MNIKTVLAATGAMLATTAWTTPKSSLDYVQSGLIAQWDGIDNVGRGRHDANAAYPVELVKGVEQTLTGTMSAHDTWFELGNGNLSFVSEDIRTAINAGHATVEICLAKNGGLVNNGGLLAFGTATRGFWAWQSSSAFCGGYSYHAVASGQYTSLSYNAEGTNTLYFILGTDTADSSYGSNGVKASGINRWTTDMGKDDTCRIGVLPNYNSAKAQVFSIRVYNRMLTLEEIAANRAVDVTRFLDGDYAQGGVEIAGSPERVGAVTPAYGGIVPSDGDLIACTAPSAWTNAAGTIRSTCTGWTLEKIDGTQTSDVGTSTSFTYDESFSGAKFTWNWSLSYAVDVLVVVNGQLVETRRSWTDADGSVTVTRPEIPTGCEFVGWFGAGIPDDGRQNEKMNLTRTAPSGVCAVFRTEGSTEDVFFVDDETGADDAEARDGRSPDTAWKTIAFAVAQASAGSTVYLAKGTHALTANVTVDKELTIRGLGEKEDTILVAALAGKTYRQINLSVAGALLHNVTLEGTKSDAGYPVRINLTGGSIASNFVMRAVGENPVKYTGQLITVTASTVSHLWATNGLYGENFIYLTGDATTRLENCYIANNEVDGGYYGGLIYVIHFKGSIRNCTIVDNKIGSGDYAYHGTDAYNPVYFQNNLVWGNTSKDDSAMLVNVTASLTDNFINNCTTPVTGWKYASQNITDNPSLREDRMHFTEGSPCNHAADPATATAYDIEGNLRTKDGAKPSIGAFEYVAPVGGFSCSIEPSQEQGRLPESVTLHCRIEGVPTGDLSYKWDFEGDGTIDSTEAEPTIPTDGVFTPSVTVTDGAGKSVSSTYDGQIGVHVAGAATYYVDYGAGDDANDGKTSGTAWKTLSTAVSKPVVWSDDVIVLSRGTHYVSGSFNVDKGVTIRGEGEKEETILVSSGAANTITLQVADARIQTMTLAGMKSDEGFPVKLALKSGTLASNLVMRAVGSNPVKNASAVIFINNGTVSSLWATNCVYGESFIYSNVGGRLENSYIANNSCDGGYYGGLIFLDNTSLAICNCTIVDNRIGQGDMACQLDGASAQIPFQNNLVWGNVSADDPTVVANINCKTTSTQNFKNNCTTPIDGWLGTGNFTDDPGLQEDRMHFSSTSKCNHGADEATATAYDIEGTLRTKDGAKPSIGAFEYVAPKGLVCFIQPSDTKGRLPDGVTLVCSVEGETTGNLTYSWDFDGDGNEDSNEAEPTISEVGMFVPSVTVTDEARHSVSTTYGGTISVHAAGRATYYVDFANGDSAYDGLTPDTAWPTLAAAVDKPLVYDDDEIVLLRGRHPMTANVTLPKRLTIRGIGKKEETILFGSGAARALTFSANNCFLHTLTIPGAQGDTYYPVALSLTAAVVSNVVFTSLGENPKAVVFYAGQVSITAGQPTLLTHVVVTNCLFGRAFSTTRDSGYYENCLFADNRVTAGDSQAKGLVQLEYCSPTFRNCTIANNRLNNSAVINTCNDSGTGRFVNSILWGNVNEGTGAVENFKVKPVQLDYSCTTTNGFETATSVGNIEADPLFKDASHGKYALTTGSPCRNAGDDSVVAPGETDLAGNPRIMSRHVDMGCYEKEGPGLMLLVK